MICITYEPNSAEPGPPYSEHEVDTIHQADEFMSTVRENGGKVIDWSELSDAQVAAHNEAGHYGGTW